MKINVNLNHFDTLTKSVKSANEFIQEISNLIETSPKKVN